MSANRCSFTSHILSSHRLISFRVVLVLLTYVFLPGCAPSLVSMDRAELEQLKHQPVIHVVHYASPSLIAHTPSSDVGLAIGGVLGGLAAVEMGKAAGEELKKQCSLEDPSIGAGRNVIDTLSQEVGFKNFLLVPDRLESDELDILKSKFENALVMDFKTHHWTLAVKPWSQWTTRRYYAVYSIRARLVRLQDPKVIWLGYSYFNEDESLSTSSTWDELKENSCTLLKAKFAQAAETSAQQLVEQLLRKTPVEK